MYFPSRIDLSKWCPEKCPEKCPDNVLIYESEIVKITTILDCNCSFTNKKSLFIDK